jgi:hypothetical protein
LSNANPAEDWTGLGARTQEEFAADSRAVCAVLAKQPREVLRILESPSVNTHSSAGWRAARMSDLAAAHAQLGDAEEAVNVLLHATDLAESGKDFWRLRRIHGIRQRWMPTNYSSDALKELDNKLAGAVPN